jgi:O-antigen ligase
MPASVGTLLYVALIAGMFWLDRDPRAQTSRALWLPVIWLSLAGSRSASEWLYLTPPGTGVESLLEGDPVNRVVYAGLVALGLVVLLFRRSKVLSLLQANGVIVVFLLYCALSLTWADYPDVGFKRWVKEVGDFVMVLIVVSERDPAVAIRRLLVRTGFMLIPLSVMMIKYYPDLARYYDRWEWSTYYSGVATNKNALGAICLLFGLTSVWQVLAILHGRQRIGRGRRLIVHVVILAMVMWLFQLANSMTALSCFLLGCIVLLVVEFRPIVRSPPIVHALVAALITVPSVVLFVGIEVILEMMGKDPTLTDRTIIWDQLLSMAPNTWIGTGFENFWLGHRLEMIRSMYSWRLSQAHNGYLEIYLNLGWAGIALVVLTLLVGYQRVMTGLHRSPSTGGLMLAYFVVGVVYNFTEAALFRISAPAWFALLLAITKVPELHGPKKWPHSDRRRTEQRALQFGTNDKGRKHAVAASRNA